MHIGSYPQVGAAMQLDAQRNVSEFLRRTVLTSLPMLHLTTIAKQILFRLSERKLSNVDRQA